MVGMSDGGDGQTLAPAGWYPDAFNPSRRRYWNGSSWTYATTDVAALGDPAPEDVNPLPDGHGLPAPVGPRPAAEPAAAAPKRRSQWLWLAAVVVGLLVGVTGIGLSKRSSSTSTSSLSGPEPSTGLSPSTSAPPPSAGSDPSATALGALIVKPEDVPETADVVLLPGGAGLTQPTLDLCSGRFPSESRRSARIQDAVLDTTGTLVFSTEAVLYADSGGTTQAFAELEAVVAACPKTRVGQPPVLTTFNPPPDAAWPQTPTVNRRAYDFTSDDGAGRTTRTIAVYLRRGRALLGVYFSQPDGAQLPVAGQTTVEGIVGVFADRMAALPTSVVGA